MMRALGHAAEAFAAWFLYYCFALLPVDTASALGGWFGRTFGSMLSVSNNARRNLKNVYPDRLFDLKWICTKIEFLLFLQISLPNSLRICLQNKPKL